MLTLDQLNAADAAEFTRLLDGTYEHCPGSPRSPGRSALLRASRRWHNSSEPLSRPCARRRETTDWR